MQFTLPQAGAVRFSGDNRGADPRLYNLLRDSSQYLPEGYSVQFKSGLRPGDPRYHGKGMAADIQIIDPSGKPLANYQDPTTFRTYEQYAQAAKALRDQQYPDVPLRWGGYFSGPKGKYGALDVMHFDLADGPMGGGSWETGLTPQQIALWPGVESVGMGNAAPALAPAINVASVPGSAQPAAAVAATGAGGDLTSMLSALDVPGALSEIFSPTKSSKKPAADIASLLGGGGGSKGAISNVMAEDEEAQRRGDPTGEDITRASIASNVAALRATGGPQKAALSDQMMAQDEQRRMSRVQLGSPMQKGSPLRNAMVMAQMSNLKF
jgi:hypothetical protein